MQSEDTAQNLKKKLALYMPLGRHWDDERSCANRVQACAVDSRSWKHMSPAHKRPHEASPSLADERCYRPFTK